MLYKDEYSFVTNCRREQTNGIEKSIKQQAAPHWNELQTKLIFLSHT